ncbi:MAG TPA: hypothetical protein VEA99_05245 [Gemmatimonadaceae bacterium]|nr:hypothetical protein [Gemmatimonadaceae bacterium]
MPRQVDLLSVLLGCALLAACDRPRSESPPSADAPPAAAATATTTPTALPDACALAPAAELARILGTDPGAPRGLDGGARKVCMYATGPTIGVEDASHYDASRQVLEQQHGPASEVGGIGEAAFWQVAQGRVGSFGVKGNGLFASITLDLPAGDAAKGLEQGKAIAALMLQQAASGK